MCDMMSEEAEKKDGNETESEQDAQKEMMFAKTYRNGRIQLPALVQSEKEIVKPEKGDWKKLGRYSLKEAREKVTKLGLIEEHKKYGHEDYNIATQLNFGEVVECPLCKEEDSS